VDLCVTKSDTNAIAITNAITITTDNGDAT